MARCPDRTIRNEFQLQGNMKLATIKHEQKLTEVNEENQGGKEVLPLCCLCFLLLQTRKEIPLFSLLCPMPI